MAMRTLYPGGPRRRQPQTDQSKTVVPNSRSKSRRWYSREYLASVWAERPAKIIAALLFIAVATILVLVFAAGSESFSFSSTDFSAGTKTGVHVDGNGHVILDQAANLGTDDGNIHLAASFHYYTADKLSDSTTARQFGSEFEMVSSQTSRVGSFAKDMIAANKNLLLMPYEKSIQYTAPYNGDNNTDFPSSWYSHDSHGTIPYLNGPGVFVMQPGTFYTATRTVNGIQGDNWFDWHSQAVKKDVDQANSAAGTSAWTGIYYDSMGTSSWANQINPQTGSQYFNSLQWATEVQKLGDFTKNRYPSLTVWGNGLRPGQSGILSHVDGGLDESWLRSNNDSFTNLQSVSNWETDEQLVIDGNKQGKGTWVVVNIQNDTAGNLTSAGCTATNAEISQWRHFSVASYLLANHGKAWLEFVPCVSHKSAGNPTVLPWTEGANSLYTNTHLGAPLESQDSITNYKAGGVYIRHFTNGLVLVNPSGSDVTGYSLGGTYVNEAGANVTSITVPKDSGIILTK